MLWTYCVDVKAYADRRAMTAQRLLAKLFRIGRLEVLDQQCPPRILERSRGHVRSMVLLPIWASSVRHDAG